MRYTVIIVEPDLAQQKQIIRRLIHAGYDALPIPAKSLLGELYQLALEPEFGDTMQAVILSDNLPADYAWALNRCLVEMKQITVIGYGQLIPFEAVTYQISRSPDQLLVLLREVCTGEELTYNTPANP